jgi:hypothetical protein
MNYLKGKRACTVECFFYGDLTSSVGKPTHHLVLNRFWFPRHFPASLEAYVQHPAWEHLGYACDGHNGNIPGVPETIFWTAPKKRFLESLPDGEMDILQTQRQVGTSGCSEEGVLFVHTDQSYITHAYWV